MIGLLKKGLTVKLAVYIVFSFIILGLGFGQLGLLSTGEIAYPSQTVLVVNKVSDEQKFYHQLTDLTKGNDRRIYHNVIEAGKQAGYVFGSLPRQTRYPLTQSKSALEQASTLGFYYVDGHLSKAELSELEALGVSFTSHPTGWQMMAYVLLLPVNLSSFALYMMLLLFGLSLYAIGMRSLRKDMIKRSLGVYRTDFLKNALWLTGIFSGLALGIVGLTGYTNQVYLLGSLVIDGLLWGLMLLVLAIVQVSYNRQLTTQSLSDWLKYRLSGHRLQYAWLFVIALSVMLTTITVILAQSEYTKAKARLQIIHKWENISQFSRLTIKAESDALGAQAPLEDLDKIASADQKLSQYEAKWRAFYDQLSDQDTLWFEKPTELTPDMLSEPITARDFDHPDLLVTVKPEWFYKLWLTNPYAVEMSQQVVDNNPTIFRQTHAVTIYVPEKWSDNQAEILSAAKVNLLDSGLTSADIELVVIPNRFMFFAPVYKDIIDMHQTQATIKDIVIVQYDLKRFPPDSKTFSTVADDIQSGLYRQEGLMAKINTSEIKDQVLDMTSPYEVLSNIQKEADYQLKHSLLTMLSMWCTQIMVFYLFIKLQLARYGKKISIGQLQGKVMYQSYLYIALLVILAITIPLMLVMILASSQYKLILGECLVYISLVMVCLAFAIKAEKRNRLERLKGEGERG